MNLYKTTLKNINNIEVVLIIGTPEEYVSYIKRIYKATVSLPEGVGRCNLLTNDKTKQANILVNISSELSYPYAITILAHELLHAVNKVLEYSNIPKENNEELMCILLDSLLYEFIIKIYNVSLKKGKE